MAVAPSGEYQSSLYLSFKDNYRPIALASVVSKVAESIIFNRISCYLDTCPNQFGFKRNHGTDQCIYH